MGTAERESVRVAAPVIDVVDPSVAIKFSFSFVRLVTTTTFVALNGKNGTESE